jgi:hypothetical protein
MYFTITLAFNTTELLPVLLLLLLLLSQFFSAEEEIKHLSSIYVPFKVNLLNTTSKAGTNFIVADIHAVYGINVFARSNTGVVGSNVTRFMDVCLYILCVCVVLCVGSGLATG